jgi:transcriptional regulator with XRE-family HTH domain
MFFTEIFGQRLRAARKAHNEKQEDLGRLLGVGKSQVSELERGTASTTLEKLSIICEHYNVSADYLLGLTDEPRPYKRKKN